MKKLFIVLLIVACTLPALAQEKKGVAVLDFKPSGVSASEASFVTDFFRNALVNSRALRLIDKSNMNQLLAEQGFQQSGCTTQECAVQMGKMLNVQVMITGNFGLLFGEYVITINLVNVETGEIEYSDSGKCSNPGMLQSVAGDIAGRLVADQTGTRPKPKPAPKPEPEPEPEPEPHFVPSPAYTPVMPAPGGTGIAGKVIKVTGNQVTVNLGSLHGLKKNNTLDVMAVVKEEKSPITGQVIRVKTKAIAKLKLTYLEPQASIGMLVSLKPGYTVKTGMLVQPPGSAKLIITSDTTFMMNQVDGYVPPGGRTSSLAMVESNTDISYKLSSFRLNSGLIYLGRFTGMDKPMPYFGGSFDTQSFEIGLGMATFHEPGPAFLLRLGKHNSGMSFILKGFTIEAYTDYTDPNDMGQKLHDTLAIVRPELNLHLSSAIKVFFKTDYASVARHYGGMSDPNGTGPSIYEPNIGTDLYAFKSEESRTAALFGLSFKPVSSITTTMIFGYCVYDGTLTLEYDLGGGPEFAQEPHKFNTQLLSIGAMVNITDAISVGGNAGMEARSNNNDSGDDGMAVMPQIGMKVEVRF